MPTSSAPTSSGPERGQTNHDHERGGAAAGRGVDALLDRRTIAATAVATVPTTAKATHAARHCDPATSAIGTASATPQPVPDEIVDRTRPWRAAGMSRATASENGG